MKKKIAVDSELREILTKIVRGQDIEQTTTTDEDFDGNTRSKTVTKSVPISAKVRAAKILLDDENGVEDCTESVTIVEDI